MVARQTPAEAPTPPTHDAPARSTSASGRPWGAESLTYLLMTLGVLMWGGNWVAARLSVGVVPPITLATLRYAIATPILLLWLASQGPLPRVQRRDWGTLLVIGVLYGVASNLLFLYGLQ